MGSCYSQPARTLHGVSTASDMPQPPTNMSTLKTHDKPTTTASHAGFGFRRPAKKSATKQGHNSNELSGVDEGGDRTVLGTLTDGPAIPRSSTTEAVSSKLAKPRPASAIGKPVRFGFTDNKTKLGRFNSSDSLTSAGSHKVASESGSTVSLNSQNLPKGTVIKPASFMPRSISGSWRMIDDESRSGSVKSSLTGSNKSKDNKSVTAKSQETKPKKPVNSKRTPDKTMTKSISSSAIPSKTASQNKFGAPTTGLRPPTKVRGPLGRHIPNNIAPSDTNGRAWVTASGVPHDDPSVTSEPAVGDKVQPRVSSKSDRTSSQRSSPATCSVKSRKSDIGPSSTRNLPCSSSVDCISTPKIAENNAVPDNKVSDTTSGSPATRMAYVESPVTSLHKTPSTELSDKSKSDKSKSKKSSPESERKKKSGPKTGGFSFRGFLRRPKSSTDSPNKHTPKSESKKCDTIPATLTPIKCNSVVEESEGIGREEVFDEVPVPVSNVPESSTAPIAQLDSVETTSVGSLDSDDLMVDFDMSLDVEDLPYAEKDAPRSRSNSGRYRRRNRSRSRERLESCDKKSVHRRKETEGGTLGRTRCGSERNDRSDSGVVEEDYMPETSVGESQTGEAVEELASLVHDTIGPVLRNPRVSMVGRPSSFPGPRLGRFRSLSVDSESTTPSRSSVLRPPRHQTSIADDDEVILDGFTYRQLLQDITMYKTYLLKLKRLIQDDEMGTPWMNGLVMSQPNSPCWEEGHRISWSSDLPSPASDKISLNELMQENADLKQQLELARRQIEEQDKTVKLLQHQMTKYECGHLGPGGRSFTHAANQAGKPYLGLHNHSLPGHSDVNKPMNSYLNKPSTPSSLTESPTESSTSFNSLSASLSFTKTLDPTSPNKHPTDLSKQPTSLNKQPIASGFNQPATPTSLKTTTFCHTEICSKSRPYDDVESVSTGHCRLFSDSALSNGHHKVNNGNHGDQEVNNGNHGNQEINHGNQQVNNGNYGDQEVNSGNPGDQEVNNGNHGDQEINNGNHGDQEINNGNHGDQEVNNGNCGIHEPTIVNCGYQDVSQEQQNVSNGNPEQVHLCGDDSEQVHVSNGSTDYQELCRLNRAPELLKEGEISTEKTLDPAKIDPAECPLRKAEITEQATNKSESKNNIASTAALRNGPQPSVKTRGIPRPASRPNSRSFLPAPSRLIPKPSLI